MSRVALAFTLLIGIVAINNARADCGAEIPGKSVLERKLRNALVKIETEGGPDKNCRSEGSGFVVAADQNLLTIASAAHVVPSHPDCAGKMHVFGRFPENVEPQIELNVLFRTPYDFVLMQADLKAISDQLGLNPAVCRIALGAGGKPADQLIFIGYFPGDTLPNAYSGFIETEIDASGTRQRICGGVNKGVSGGPVVGQEGSVIGLMRERLTQDVNGNEVVGKGIVLPVTKFQAEIESRFNPNRAPLCLDADVADFGAGTNVQEAILPSSITVPHHVSDLRDDYQTAPASDLARFALETVLNQEPDPLRYPRSYEKHFDAEPGFIFKAVSDIRLLSHNRPQEPLPTTDCSHPDDCIKFSADKRSMIVRYRLFSGPAGIDQTRGWIDLIINTQQVRAS